MGLRGAFVSGAAVLAVGIAGYSVRSLHARPLNTSAIIMAATAADFQSALDSVQPGQTIVLEAGHVYQGPFELPNKTGNGWITIQTSTPARIFPPPGTRVGPADGSAMPQLVASQGSVLTADPGAHNYRFIGIEFAPDPGIYLEDVVDLGTGATTLDAVPHDFDFERCYFHGDPTAGARRGIALNSASTTIADSYFADFKEVGFDSQAICGWNGPGPFTITNNYLEGAGENVMFGGADPTIPNLVPSNISITRNYFSKPVSWRQGSGPPTTPHWTVKNVFELKNAQQVVIDSNVFEHNWADAQVGFAILFTPRNQDGGSPWSTVANVTFSNNIVRDVAAGVDILGTDDIQQSQPLSNLQIRNNLFIDIGGSWGFGRLFELLNGTTNVTINHNTGLQTETPVFGGDTTPHVGFVFENNIVLNNQYGFIGSGTAPGLSSINHYFPNSTILQNVIVGGTASLNPPNNFFPATLATVGFINPALGNYGLSGQSPYAGKATDGTDIGVNMRALAQATAGVVPQAQKGSAAADLAELALVVFWGAAMLVGYTYAGYPLLMRARASLAAQPARGQYEPDVSVLVVAHNEETQIAERIRNLLAQDYPADRREIVVVSDGSTDETVARARAVDSSVTVIERPLRQGKATVFNEVLPTLSGEVVVLADARQRFDPGAIRALVARFADPRMGAVSGELVLATNAESGAGSQGAEAYWSYEKRLRWWESQVDSTIGVTGAIVAVRRTSVPQIPADTILDDVLIPMRIVRAGLRVGFEPRARAYDRLSCESRREFRRKVRTLAGTFQLFARERWVWLPWRNRLWLETLSHKGLRLVLPVLFVLVAAANLALVNRPFYQLTLAAQVGFYGLAALAGSWPGLRRRVRPLVLPYAICFLAGATVVGFLRFALGRQSATWERTPPGMPLPMNR